MKYLKYLGTEKSAFFVGGVAVAMVAKKVLKSKSLHNLAVSAVAGGMKIQKEAAYQLEAIKEDAEDLVRQKEEAAKAECNCDCE
ncbi:MAG: hypothetical protein SOR77_03765 [Peptoniphilus sp.]|uniref:hypothetical protein n=1 Tax=Peptoniphilus sp. TaxID=1971214 RepID=UPI002A74734A|nr:hypothetical protein [Peptoniphilus sp.]MDY2986734.1 hypothetical protein [Peptoniphilus sp.]